MAITAILVLNTAAHAQTTFDFNATRNPQFLVWDPGLTAVGWYITPNVTLNLTKIETNFNPVIQPGSQNRIVTVEILTDRRSVGGTLLRSATFDSAMARGQLGGGSFSPIMLTAGTTYFIGFRNIGGIGINTTNDAGAVNCGACLYVDNQNSAEGQYQIRGGSDLPSAQDQPILRLSTFCGEMSGQVSNAQGAVVGAMVQACRPNFGACVSNATTNAAGNYQLFGLQLNTSYDLMIFPPAGSNNLQGELLARSVASCSSPLVGQNVVLQTPILPPAGTDIQPRQTGDGGVPTVFWQNPLLLTTTGCLSGSASYNVMRGTTSVSSGSMTETPLGSGTYRANVPSLAPAHGSSMVTMSIICPGGGGTQTTGFNVYIDPSGVVQTPAGALIPGATVTLFRSNNEFGPFTVVPDGSAIMSPGNRRNTDMTDAAGHFGWDVIAGFYKVRAEKSGCNAPGDPSQSFVETGILTIPPPVTDLVLTLQCSVSPTVSVSGRVTTPDGRGLRNATVSITDPVGAIRTATTSSFGFYSFEGVATGQSYTLRVSSRLYRFAQRTVQVTDTLTDVDFVGLE